MTWPVLILADMEHPHFGFFIHMKVVRLARLVVRIKYIPVEVNNACTPLAMDGRQFGRGTTHLFLFLFSTFLSVEQI
jgi:hypothetical protein